MKMIPLSTKSEFIKRMSSLIQRESNGAYPPEYSDLYSLYANVRLRAAVAILEIGSGWSTLALAMGLYENCLSFGPQYVKEVRHPNPFTILSLDASEKYLRIAHARVPTNWFVETNIRMVGQVSTPSMTTVSGKVCHTFEPLPSFTADFVYLDGPDCDQVLEDVNGFSVDFGASDQVISGQVFPEHHYGLPMSADLLLIEHFFWPGSAIAVDGRGANASYLRSEFRRRWTYSYDKDLDQHWFELDDEPWGSVCASHLEIRRAARESLAG